MDATDYGVYRYLSPDGFIRLWGSRRTVDPRVTVSEIAARVGLSEAGARSRLRTLENRGYLRGRETWPNLSLFGVSLSVSVLPVAGSGEAKSLLKELSLVDGVTFARDILDESNREIRVFHVFDTTSGSARRVQLLKRLSPSGVVRGPSPYWIPPSPAQLSPLDWRILSGYRRHPESTLRELASETRVSVKTTSHRLYGLLDRRAVWSTLSSSSEEMPLALLTIATDTGADLAAVTRSVVEANPTWLPVADDGLGSSPADGAHAVVGLVPAESPSALEQSIRRTLDIDGVANVRRTFALGSASYPDWIDDQLKRAMPSFRAGQNR